MNGDPYPSDRASASTLHVPNISLKSLPFDSSKYSSHIHPADQEMITSIKGERRIDLSNEPFFLEEKTYSAHLTFKKRFVFEFEDRDSFSHVDKTSTKVFENESNGSKPKPLFDLTSRPDLLF